LNIVFLRELLTTSRVAELGLKEIPVIDATQSVADAVGQMRAHSHGSALVCQSGTLVGIFTERDLVKHLAAGGSLEVPLVQVMTGSPRTVTPDDSLMTVIRLMDEGGYRRLPVVREAGSPAGVVDVKSVVHFLVEHFPKAVYNQAPHALVKAKDREGA
jgi:CBS domain-containing protein